MVYKVGWLTHCSIGPINYLKAVFFDLTGDMENTEALFNNLRDQLIQQHASVHEGTMMSSPGIQYQKKNFAFYYQEAVCFRLGRDFDPASEGIHDYRLLSPFKTKPPLKDWFIIGAEYQDQWPLLAEIALQQIKK